MMPGWIELLNQIKMRFDHEGIVVKNLAGNPADPLIRKFMNEKLEGMIYIGEAALAAGVEGYVFSGSDHQTWVVWSKDETPQEVTVPSNLLSVYDKYGQEIDLPETIASPLYFDMKP